MKRGEEASRVGPVSLAVLVCIGQFKENPLFAWIPVDLTILAAAFVVLMVVRARVRLGPTTGRVTVPLVLWTVFLFGIAAMQFDPYSTVKVGSLFTISLVLAVAPFYLLRVERQRRAFLAATAVIAVFFAASALFFDPTTAAEYTNRLILEGTSTIGTARVAMAGAIVMILFAFDSSARPVFRFGLLVAALLTTTLGVMTGSRGPVLAALIAVFAVILLAPLLRKFRGRALFGFFAVAAIAVWVAVSSGSDGVARIMQLFDDRSDTSSAARMGLWQDAADIIANHPFGIGWGMYRPPGLEHGYPHNLILEVGVEAGWLPMILVALLLVVTAVRGVMVSTQLSTTALFGLYLFSVFNAMVSSDINGTRLLWVALFALWVVPLPGHEDRPFYTRASSGARLVRV